MNFLDAAFEILKQANTPLHYAEIARLAMSRGLLETSGQTPESTMGSRLYVDTNRPESRFHRAGRGFFELSKQVDGDEIGQRVEELNLQTRKQLRQVLADMPADRFEALISELLIAIGFDEASVQVTRYSGDRGYDGQHYSSPSTASRVASGYTCNGWKYWWFEEPTTRQWLPISELRPKG